MMAFVPNRTAAYLATARGVYETTNGTTFAPTHWPIRSPMNVAIDPEHPKTIFVGANVGGHGFGTIYYSTDGGASWKASAGIAPDSESYSGDVPAIAVSPTDSKIVFATTATQVFRSVDGGRSFATVLTVAPDLLLANAARRRMNALRYGESDDRAGRPHDLDSPGVNLGEELVFDDDARRGEAAPLVLTLPTRKLLVTMDYGAHWHDISSNAISHWFSQVAFQHGVMYLATMGEGVLKSKAPLEPVPPR